MPTEKEPRPDDVLEDLTRHPEGLEYVRRRIEDQDRRLAAIEKAIERLLARREQDRGDDR